MGSRPENHWQLASCLFPKPRKEQEVLRKYYVIDFGNVPLSSKVLWSGAGDKQNLKMKINQNSTAMPEMSTGGLALPVKYSCVFEVARTDIEPQFDGEIKQVSPLSSNMQLLNHLTTGFNGMSVGNP